MFSLIEILLKQYLRLLEKTSPKFARRIKSRYKRYYEYFKKYRSVLDIFLLVYLVAVGIIIGAMEINKTNENLQNAYSQIANLQQKLESQNTVSRTPTIWATSDYDLPALAPQEESLYYALIDFSRFAISQNDLETAVEKLNEAEVLVITPEIDYLSAFIALSKGNQEEGISLLIKVGENTDLALSRRQNAISQAIILEMESKNYQSAFEIFEQYSDLLLQKNTEN